MKNILILLLIICASATAQENRHEKIKALKRAHITEALELTVSEAEKFWPIYNAHEKKMFSLRKIERAEIHSVFKNNNVESLSDAEANELLEKSMELRTQGLNNDNELIRALREVLPPKKILKLTKAEDEFKRNLLRKMRQNKGKKP